MDAYLTWYIWQGSITWPIVALCIGVIVYLLPYKFQKLSQSNAYRLINFIALIFITIGIYNLGYWGADNDWQRDAVRQDRSEEIQKLEELQNRR